MTQKFLWRLAVGLCCLVPVTAAAESTEEAVTLSIDPDQVQIRYQPYDESTSAPCKVIKSTVGLHEFDVYCLVGQRRHTYAMHLVASKYARSRYGYAVYEVLYWITDRTVPNKRTYDSTTIWIHHTDKKAKVAVLEAYQGIENDMASLQLKLNLQSGR